MSDGLLSVFKVLIGITIPMAAFVSGLRATDPLWLWKRPRLLGRSLLAVLVVVPIVAIALVEWLGPANLPLRAGIAIAILSIGIGPPNMMKKSRARDEAASFQVGLNVTLLTLAIVYLPVAVAIHGAVFGHHVGISVGQVARVVLTQALVPFLAGVALVRLWSRVGRAAERYAERFVNAAMLVLVLFLLAISWRGLVGVGARGWLVCAAIAMIAIVIGHMLGGPAPATRSVLALSSTVRFPALALLLASVVPRGERLIPVVLAYVLSSLILSGVYVTAMARSSRETGARGRPVVT